MPDLRLIDIRNAHPRLRLDKKSVAKIIHTLDAHHDHFNGGCPDGELSLAFLTDKALAKLHGDFLDDPTTTDVITFEGQPALDFAGEVCLSADTASTFAKTHGNDFSEELTLYVVHGWLHLAGYDDLVPAKKRRMRTAEARALKILRTAKAIPCFTLQSLSPSLCPLPSFHARGQSRRKRVRERFSSCPAPCSRPTPSSS